MTNAAVCCRAADKASAQPWAVPLDPVRPHSSNLPAFSGGLSDLHMVLQEAPVAQAESEATQLLVEVDAVAL